MDTSGFLRRWDAVVRRHAAAADDDRARLIRAVLDRGLDAALGEWPGEWPGDETGDGTGGGPGGENGVTQAERLACERDLVAASGLFDEFAYFRRNHHLWWSLCGHDEELRDYVRSGWRELRSPNPDIDLWWYWLTYLDPTREDVDPLVHWLAEGRHLGHPARPEVQPLRPTRPAPGRQRRIVLFAGYDPDGIVDDTVVAYVQELSRFADVFYLADCDLEEGELDKLAPYTRGRWAIRHGCYDFGSYSMLARELVGWGVVETYDELVLVNDSCFLVRPLDEVFATMDRTAAEWWGLQATYDVFSRWEQQRLGRRLRIEEVTDGMRALGGRTHAASPDPGQVNPFDDRFHVGSYFVAFRSAVMTDPEFRRRLDTVAAQTRKTAIVRKYEIGISRYLVLAGYHVATFVDGILPFHPAYRESAFDLLREGFPLLKRQLLGDNPFDTPGLSRWRSLVGEACPGADLDRIEDNLLRVSAPWAVFRSFGVRRRADGTVVLPAVVGPEHFDEEDRWVPKHPHWWAFPVDPITHRLEGNARAVFEAVRADPSIRKILLTAEGSPRLSGANVVTHRLETPAGQFYALRAGQVFVSRGARQDLTHPLSGDLHQFVLLGRGSPLQAFGAAVPVGDGAEEHLRHNVRVHDLDLTRAAVVASRDQARAVWRSLASPSRPERWVTGMPRTDLVLAAADSLPEDLRRQEIALRNQVGDRRLVLWAPADGPDLGPAALDEEGLARLADLADRHQAVVGVRDPAMTGGGRLLDVTADRFPDIEMVLRVTAVLVSDHAPELIDFLVTDRPVVCFSPHIASLRAYPGLVHDLDEVLPGGVHRDLDALIAAVATALDGLPPEQVAAYAEARDSMHEHRDGRCAARLVRRVKATYLPVRRWLAEQEHPQG